MPADLGKHVFCSVGVTCLFVRSFVRRRPRCFRRIWHATASHTRHDVRDPSSASRRRMHALVKHLRTTNTALLWPTNMTASSTLGARCRGDDQSPRPFRDVWLHFRLRIRIAYVALFDAFRHHTHEGGLVGALTYVTTAGCESREARVRTPHQRITQLCSSSSLENTPKAAFPFGETGLGSRVRG